MKLNYFAPANVTSYGYTSLYLMRELIGNGVDLRYFPIGSINPDEEFMDLKNHFNPNFLLHKNTPCLKVWHQHDLSHFVGNGPTIGFPIFELNNFSEREKNHLDSLDKIIVPTNWARQVVLQHLPDADVSVVSLGFNDTVFVPSPSAKQIDNSKPFVFANFGKWEVRKGHDILLHMFTEAFNESDNVELWLMPHNLFLNEHQQRSWEEYYFRSKLGSKIKIFPRMATQRSVAEIMSKIDCAIFPARAEGWNLEALECLACGKNVIATNYSGHTEFLNEDNSYLINGDQFESAYDGVFFNGDGEWLSFNQSMVTQFIDRMREVYNNGPQLNQKAIQSASNFTWKKSGEKLVKVLASVTN